MAVTEAAGDVDRLRRRLAEIEACVRAFAVVGGTFDLDELLRRAMRSAQEVMNAEASAIMLKDEATGDLLFRVAAGDDEAGDLRAVLGTIRVPRGEGIAGWVAETGEPALVPDAQGDPRLFRKADEKTGFVTRSLIAVPLLSGDRVIGVAEVLNKREGTFDADDLRSFQAYAALVASAIETARLHKRLLGEAIDRREIEMARRIQENLQGPAEASAPGVSFGGLSLPARDVGGDLFDFLPLEGGRVGLLLGDVSGKGVPAALLMANVLSRFRARATPDPSATLAELNRALCEATTRGLFVTVVYHVLDPAEGALRFAAAGHPPGLVWRAERGAVDRLPPPQAPPIGILPEAEFPEASARLWPGDILLVASDGVTEARAPGGAEFGEGRLAEVLREAASAGLPARSIADAVARTVSTFGGGEDARDDVTVAVLKAEPACVHALETVRFAVRACPEALADVRAAAERYARRAGLDARTAGQVVLALDEACANVIRHGYRGGAGAIDVSLEYEGGEFRIRIEDRARPFRPDFEGRAPGMPAEEAVSGRGLGIIHAVMDDVRYVPGEVGTTLLMTKRLGGRTGAGRP